MVSTFSFWEKQWISRADVVIIGSGIVGLQCAQRIKEAWPHREVWVIDRAPIGLGASMRNAGFACFGSMGEILDEENRTSSDEALGLYEKRYRGIGLLMQEYGTTAIGYEKTGGYEIFENHSEPELLRIKGQIDRINDSLKQVTGETTFQVKPASRLEMNVLSEAVYTPVEGAIQTHLLYAAILKKTKEAGVQVLTGWTVSSLEEGPGQRWRINTSEGYAISCRQLVLCTNGFTKELWPDAAVEPARGQVLVTSHIPSLAWRGLMHADQGYIYFRSLGTRILIGGARNQDFDGETTTSLEITSGIQSRLVDFLKQVVLPGIPFEITDQWSGIMGMNQNRNPIVEQWKPNLFACVRMGGMGVALSAVVSRQLAALMQENAL